MISFNEVDGELLLTYEADQRWTGLDARLREGEEVLIRKTFSVSSNDLVQPLPDKDDAEEFIESTRVFKIGTVDDNYYWINKGVLDLKHDLRIAKQVKLEPKLFIAHRDISIFSRIDALCEESIIIGGDVEGAIPVDEFRRLLKTFPTSTEVDRYAASRITHILKDYLDTMSDAETKLQDHLRRKELKQEIKRAGFVAEYETDKFEFVRDELKAMLDSPEGYSEADWQRRILNFILLIFPKYVAVLSNLQINDFYSMPGSTKKRFIDLTLVDAGGTIDIIEIKKPFERCLLSNKPYRDNFTPKKELSGAVMQAEKYIFHLSKWGQAGEVAIQKARASELPPGLKIQITNPKALLILGRDNDFTTAERLDFEIIKRKYANMMDILTYDDLLRRLNNIIYMMKRDLTSTLRVSLAGSAADGVVL
ncbi:MAG: Shedu immune nuclease family protein [Betaproteobacteria bacterium]